MIRQGDGVLVSALGLHDGTRAGEDRALAGPYLYVLAELRRAPGRVLASSARALGFFSRDAGGRWQPDGQLATLPSGMDDILEPDDGLVWVTTRTGEIWRIDFRRGVSDTAPARRYGPDHGVPTALRRDNLRVFTLGSDLLAASAHGLLVAIPRRTALCRRRGFRRWTLPPTVGPTSSRRRRMAARGSTAVSLLRSFPACGGMAGAAGASNASRRRLCAGRAGAIAPP
ncbi:MAG: hypothetical protein H7343_18485 [Undibacterium sp.]|nr:hypothetical protein [Opitutaceae bacterium]